MKKQMLSIFLLTVLIFTFFSSCAVVNKNRILIEDTAVKNLLPNGSFEEYSENSPNGWSGGGEISTNQVKEGKVSLKLAGEQTSKTTFSLSRFEHYAFTMWVYKVDENSTLSITKDLGDLSENLLDGIECGKWVPISENIRTSNSSKRLFIIQSTGTIYVDDASVFLLDNAYLGKERTYLSDVKFTSYDMGGKTMPGIDDDFAGKGNIGLTNLATFEKGIRLCPTDNNQAQIIYNVEGYDYFTSYVGKDIAGQYSPDITFEIYLDGVLKDTSKKLTWKNFDYFELPLEGASELKIVEKVDSSTPNGGGVMPNASLYKSCEKNDIIILTPAENNIITARTLDVSGITDGDKIEFYVDNNLIASNITIRNGLFYATICNLPKDEFSIVIKEYKNGKIVSTSREMLCTSNIASAYVSDIPWQAMQGRLPTPVRDKSNYLKTLSVGNTAVTATKGFEVVNTTHKALDVTIDISAVSFEIFMANVGICDSLSAKNGDSVVYVIADGVTLYTSEILKYGTYADIVVNIPQGTKFLTLRTESSDGDYTQDIVDWCNPILIKNKATFFENRLPLYNNEKVIGSEKLSDCGIAFKSDTDFTAIAVKNFPKDTIAMLYKWNYSYSRTLQSAPITTARINSQFDDNLLPFMRILEKGEYFILFKGSGDVDCYSSDNAVLYAFNNPCESAAPAISIIPINSGATLGSCEKDLSVLSAINIAATEKEKARAIAQFEGYINNLSTFPSTMKVGEKEYNGFNEDFTLVSKTTKNDGKAKVTTINLMHTSGLSIEIAANLYPDYAAYDYVMYIENKTKANSPVISNLLSVNMMIEGEKPYLTTSGSDHGKFEPIYVDLENTARSFTTTTGRSTENVFPYYNFEYGNRGMLFAVGWAGCWESSFENNENKTQVTAGQKTFSSYLKPNEKVRTPLCAFVLYDGRDTDRATNLWRNWYIDAIMHRVERQTEDGKTEMELFEPTMFAATSTMFNEMATATDQTQIDGIKTYVENGVDINFWWMDAGWYLGINGQSISPSNPVGWQATGSWLMDKERFPSAMADVSEYAKENGIRTLLWFEPERVGMGVENLTTTGETINPNWLLDNTLVNLGKPEAAAWIINRILTVMGEGKISLYREDFNIHPLGYWQFGDNSEGANRSGITENLYLQGHFKIWDTVLEAFPEAIIDSCASGGNRNDFDTMTRAVALHKTDYVYSDHSTQQCFAWGYAQWLPYFGTKTDGGDTDMFSNKYAIRTAMVPATVFGYDYTDPIDWAFVRDGVEEHKKLADYYYSNFYQLTPYSRKEEDRIAWEYFDETTESGFALVFRRKLGEKTQNLKLKGLDLNKNYYIWFEDRNNVKVYSGKDLMKRGINVTLPTADSSDIVYIRETSHGYDNRHLQADITYTSKSGQYGKSIEESEDMCYFDIRFNMSLRDTVLTNDEGTSELNIKNEYLEDIILNDTSLAEIAKTNNVYADYDAANNILRVFVAKSAGFTPDKDNTVTLKKSLATYEGVTLADDLTFNYAAQTKAFTK